MGEIAIRSERVIAGKWVLDRRLGRGGMGEVWLATHQTLGQHVAVKILDRDAFPLEVADEARSRFDLEARIAAQLARRTRHIVTVVDNGRDGEIDYLVMELLEGESLEDRLGSGVLEPSLVADVIRQAARGLSIAHQDGVIHRDLKPSNLYLTVDDNGERLVKLLDFGIAKARPRSSEGGPQTSHATRAGVIIGTAHYMSPEQARGLEIDARADVWALGAVAYELLTANPPHAAENELDLLMKICMETPPSPRVHRPSLPFAVDAVFARAFAPSIDERFEDVRSFADALARALESSVVVPSRAPESVVTYVATPPPMELPRRSRAPLFVGAAVLVALSIAAGAFLTRKPEPAVASQPSASSASTKPEPAPSPSVSVAAPVSASASATAEPVPSPVPKVHAPPPIPKPVKKTDKSEIL